MRLARDLLDNQVADENGHKLGKVDGIVGVLRRGKPPRLSAIELGLSTIGTRINARFGRWLASLERKLGVSEGNPVRIPFDRIQRIGIDVVVRFDASHSDIYAWEKWIDRVLICRIPGSGSGVPDEEKK